MRSTEQKEYAVPYTGQYTFQIQIEIGENRFNTSRPLVTSVILVLWCHTYRLYRVSFYTGKRHKTAIRP